jgi:hypothetical protein
VVVVGMAMEEGLGLEVEGGSDKGVPPVSEREREGRVEWPEGEGGPA